MSNKVKNVIIIVQSILLVIITIAGCIYFAPKVVNKIKSIQQSEQHISLLDNISELEFYDSNNTKTKFSDKYKLMIYLSKDCSTCISHIPAIKRINETFCNDQEVELMLMWIDELPDREMLNYYGLEECSYVLNNIALSDSYNTVFLIDKTNNVIFMQESEYEGILDKIIELNILDKDRLILSTNEYIISNLAKNHSGKPNMIYFSMPGCPDCADADPIVYSESVIDVFHMTRIELVRGAEQYDIKDEYNIFKKVYSIDWYPSFLIIHNNNKWDIVRKVELSGMEEVILSKAK